MRVLVYDQTCGGRGGGLSRVWATGSALYRRLGRIDAAHGVDSWDAAFGWLSTIEEPITELQYWGHGKWGTALVGHDVFERFVHANPFVKALYPNFEAGKELPHFPNPQASGLKPLFERALSVGTGRVLENMARAIYTWHLKRRAATWQSLDQVRLEAECLKLHTSSHRAATLEAFEAAVKQAIALGDRRSQHATASVPALRG